MMEDMILSVNTLPYPLHRRFHSDRVRIHEENGTVILTPVQDTVNDTWEILENLRSMLADGRMSSENYKAQKQLDKELEG